MAKVKLGDVVGFEWDEANIAHIAKHNVMPKEVSIYEKEVSGS